MTASPALDRPALPRPVALRRRVPVFGLLLVAVVLAVLVSAALGQFAIAPGDVLASVVHKLTGLAHPARDPYAEATLWQVRMPRVLMSAVVGCGLALAGAVMQGVFGNPLADPGIVGVSSGSALGAAAVIASGVTTVYAVPAAAFATGLVATLAVYALSRSHGRTEVVTVVLTGVGVNAVCGAGLALCTFLGNQQQREQIVFWQLGSLNGIGWNALAVAAPLVAVGTVAAVLMAPRLDLLALGDRAARHAGVDVERLRLACIVTVAVVVAAAVSFAGIIAFVGLVVPHLVRMALGPGHRTLVPASAAGGALLLVVADLVARTAIAYADLPIGILTALVGGPVFFALLRRARSRAGGWL